MSKGRIILHSLLFVACLGLGYDFGVAASETVLGLIIGLAAWLAFLSAEILVRRLPPHRVLGGVLGFALCAFVAGHVGQYFDLQNLYAPLAILYFTLFSAIGGVCGAHASGSFRFFSLTSRDSAGKPLLIDTSALIDGRVADLAALGLLVGEMLIPRFVLAETQTIADSPDNLKRARGRRGLTTAERLQSSGQVRVKIVEDDNPAEREVDAKLVRLAILRDAKLVTTDYNLAKVAGVEGVEVLNVHELSIVMRPAALPGESFKVVVQKPGKEAGQGIGYLDDGTMVVIENGSSMLDRQVEAVVSSSIQTSSGRMVFARLADDSEGRGGR